MLTLPPAVRVYVSAAPANMHKSYDGLSALVFGVIGQDPMAGHLFVFFSRRADQVKVLYWDRTGYCIWSKRLERGRFLWPSAADGTVTITAAQLGYLLEGIDWRMPQKTWRPTAAG